MRDDPPQHHETWYLLPALASGRASPAEHERAGRHLAQCAECREELARERRLAAALARPPEAGPDLDAGLARLMRRVDAAALVQSPAPARARPLSARAAWARFGPTLVLGLGALELVVLALLVGWALRGPAPGGAALYRTLGDAPVAAPGPRWRLVPAPELHVAALKALLAQEGLGIVQGPSEAGVFTLAPRTAPEGAPLPAAEAEAVAARLRQAPGVRFAEFVGEATP